MYTKRQLYNFWQIFKLQPIGISNLIPLMEEKISVPTLNRELANLKANGLIDAYGKGPSLKYQVHIKNLMVIPLPLDDYFKTRWTNGNAYFR